MMVEFNNNQYTKEILDLQEIRDLQNIVRDQLKGILQVLKNKRENLPHSEWVSLIQKTKERVLENPDQFIEGMFPSRQTLQIIVENVFKAFVDQQNKYRWEL